MVGIITMWYVLHILYDVLIVGFGGGSSMDVAKIVSYLGHSKCAQQLKDIYGVGRFWYHYTFHDNLIPLL